MTAIRNRKRKLKEIHNKDSIDVENPHKKSRLNRTAVPTSHKNSLDFISPAMTTMLAASSEKDTSSDDDSSNEGDHCESQRHTNVYSVASSQKPQTETSTKYKSSNTYTANHSSEFTSRPSSKKQYYKQKIKPKTSATRNQSVAQSPPEYTGANRVTKASFIEKNSEVLQACVGGALTVLFIYCTYDYFLYYMMVLLKSIWGYSPVGWTCLIAFGCCVLIGAMGDQSSGRPKPKRQCIKDGTIYSIKLDDIDNYLSYGGNKDIHHKTSYKSKDSHFKFIRGPKKDTWYIQNKFDNNGWIFNPVNWWVSYLGWTVKLFEEESDRALWHLEQCSEVTLKFRFECIYDGKSQGWLGSREGTEDIILTDRDKCEILKLEQCA